MTMNFELKMTQSHRMIITQELRQSIALLQLSAHELLDCIQEELTANPLLEIAEDDGEAPASLDTGKEEQDAVADYPEAETEAHAVNIYDIDTYTGNYPDDIEFSAAYLPMEPRYERKTGFLENCLSQEKTLYDHLSLQLKISAISECRQLIGEYLIGNIDANGYLRDDPDEHARYLGISLREIREVLTLIQSFDPPGVGACTLEECLLLQLRYGAAAPPHHAEKIIACCLPELAAGKYRRIARKLGISLEELQDALAFIRRLNPKPGACFGDGTEVSFITPDVVVEKINGQYVVANSGHLPRLVVNSFYRGMLRQSGDADVRGFIKKNLEGALWFIKSVEHRKKVIYQVGMEIVRVQEPFLEKGLHHLKPLNLKTVAAAIGVHESTVSRATANKYMQTPRGLFPMKFFFPGSLDGEAGALYACASIKQALREFIENEDPVLPLSDHQLMERLCRQGIKISRRTVAKYREELEIPASFRRRSLLI